LGVTASLTPRSDLLPNAAAYQAAATPAITGAVRAIFTRQFLLVELFAKTVVVTRDHRFVTSVSGPFRRTPTLERQFPGGPIGKLTLSIIQAGTGVAGVDNLGFAGRSRPAGHTLTAKFSSSKINTRSVVLAGRLTRVVYPAYPDLDIVHAGGLAQNAWLVLTDGGGSDFRVLLPLAPVAVCYALVWSVKRPVATAHTEKAGFNVVAVKIAGSRFARIGP